MILVYLVEQHASGDIFDYSATQLLAAWSRDLLDQLPALHSVVAQLQGLARSVILTKGMGQAEVWSLFRDGAIENIARKLDPEVLQRIHSVKDIGESKQVICGQSLILQLCGIIWSRPCLLRPNPRTTPAKDSSICSRLWASPNK